MANGIHKFGGPWTDQKLKILGEYLSRYTTALSRQKFRRVYIDAFAGSGTRQPSGFSEGGEVESPDPQPALFPQLLQPDFEPQLQGFLDGSARVALQCQPEFDDYIFIEKDLNRCDELEHLKADFPHLAERIDIQRGEANAKIEELCIKDWANQRAVLFLDPYGTQVLWKTIELVAKTKAIDLWILFPMNAVMRMLKRSGEIPNEWRTCLNNLFGTEDWYERFYRNETTTGLFGPDERTVKANARAIEEYFLERLNMCFPGGVAPKPAVLRNSKNSTLYLLCFAVGNPKGKPIALRMATSILKKMAS